MYERQSESVMMCMSYILKYCGMIILAVVNLIKLSDLCHQTVCYILVMPPSERVSGHIAIAFHCLSVSLSVRETVSR